MREIKFRGKTETGQWVYGSLIPNYLDNVFYIENSFLGRMKVVPETVGQFTGLGDSKDNRIYEGDIVEEDLWRWVVEFSDKYSSIYIMYKPSGEKLYFDDMIEVIKNGMVIGNIYENPELLP